MSGTIWIDYRTDKSVRGGLRPDRGLNREYTIQPTAWISNRYAVPTKNAYRQTGGKPLRASIYVLRILLWMMMALLAPGALANLNVSATMVGGMTYGIVNGANDPSPYKYLRLAVSNPTRHKLSFSLTINSYAAPAAHTLSGQSIEAGAQKIYDLPLLAGGPLQGLNIQATDSDGDRSNSGVAITTKLFLNIAPVSNWASEAQMQGFSQYYGFCNTFLNPYVTKYGSTPAGFSSSFNLICQIEPTPLPDNWLCYTPFRAVFVPEDVFKLMEAAGKAALLRWVDAGGCLVVYNSTEQKTEKRLLGTIQWRRGKPIEEFAAQFEKIKSEVESGRVQTLTATPSHTPALGAPNYDPLTGMPTGPAVGMPAAPPPGMPISSSPSLKEMNEAMSMRDTLNSGSSSGSGRIFRGDGWMAEIATSGKDKVITKLTITNPALALPAEWRAEGAPWQKFYGNGGNFSYPFAMKEFSRAGSVGGLVLATIFCIVAGPINYAWLRRRRRIRMLMVTLPAFSLGFCLLITIYFIASRGFTRQGGTFAVTVLDPDTRSGVTFARHALISGLYPLGGFTFDRETALVPMERMQGDRPNEYQIDLTRAQQLRSGLFVPSVAFHYLTVTPQTTRERLIHDPAKGTVTNGFEHPAEAVIVMRGGIIYVAKNVAPGAKATLEKLKYEEAGRVDEVGRVYERYLPPGELGALRAVGALYDPVLKDPRGYYAVVFAGGLAAEQPGVKMKKPERRHILFSALGDAGKEG